MKIRFDCGHKMAPNSALHYTVDSVNYLDSRFGIQTAIVKICLEIRALEIDFNIYDEKHFQNS